MALLGKRETQARFWWGNLKKGGACSTYGGEERYIQGFGGGKPEGKRLFGILRRRGEDNI